MGDVCTGNPTQTIFATSTSQAAGAVSTSTSQSVSIGQGSVVTRSVQSGTEWVFTESSVGGGTATVPVEVPVTVSGEQQVFAVPISTLFAPCTSESSTSTSSTPTSTTPTSTSTPQTSTTPTSTRPETTETPESETSQTERSTRITSPTSTPPPTSNANSTPVASPPSTPNNQPASSTSATGTLTTLSTAVPTTLSNGDQSMVVIVTTSSIAPSGALNGNDNSGNSGGGSSSNSGRAVAIGVGVAGGVIALIILIFGITWHIRRKRRNAMPLDDSEIWGPHHENKTPPPGVLPVNHGPGYTYNPYSEVRPAAYAPVPTMSPPRARPMVLAESDDNRLSAGSYGPPGTTATGLTAPLLSRAKTADEILYEAAREGLPKSRASSATASHHTRPSETLSHRANQSYTASHKTHGSMASRTSGSAVGLLDHPPPSSTHGSLNQDAQAAQRYQDLMDAPVAPERPMSPVSIAAPRLAIVNPDVDKDL